MRISSPAARLLTAQQLSQHLDRSEHASSSTEYRSTLLKTCSDMRALFFHNLFWYVLQISMGLWQFVTIPVAIIFRVFFKNRDVFITRLETLLQLSQLFLVCLFTTERGTFTTIQMCVRREVNVLLFYMLKFSFSFFHQLSR